ncbi:hypothetical protein QBC46DRAFT_397181 [Diplogelasinospora grovesii]|uniref:DUF6604 domain-containing protein n=1 Tax=Diplogelasinospora grovesii TaxID=303347 RepID=A0AAN6MY02_9PEZI|nr:hypothetical protein QBC46DRAFT_397181 [Diplogelasinospora grovesii]
MLPEPLISIYQQYKQDTDAVAAWLASTARKCGFPADLLSNPLASGPPQRATGRRKGKARRDAKKTINKDSVGQAKFPKYIVAIRDFVPLAEFIAAYQKPRVSVPESFSSTIDRVITVRAGFGDQLNEHGAEIGEKSALSHQYFVGVLENVRQVLKPHMSSATSATSFTTVGKLSGNATEDLSNRFDALKLYEPSQQFLDAPDVERPQKVDDDEKIYEAEPQTSFYDAMVAYTMMMNDLNSIRSHIEWIWTNYRVGVFDLAAAAVATNTAVDLARNLAEDATPLFNGHGGTWKMANTLYFMECLRKGYAVEDVYVPGVIDFNYDTYEIADRMFFNAYRALLSFRDVLNPRCLPLIKEGVFGTYDPGSDRNAKSGRGKYEEDQVLLMEFFTELMTVVRCVRAYPVQDEFLRGMKELDETREVPFYLVFAAQIYLDIHHILRDEASRGFEYLLQQTTFIDNDLGRHLEFHAKLKIESWPASNDHMLRALQSKIKWIASDPVWKAKLKVYQRQGDLVPATMKPHRILQYSPVIAGLMLYHFRAEMYDVGIAVANAWGSITYSLHLYNALQCEGLLSEPWADMEVVRTLIRESNFYVGDRPRNPEEYFSRFCLQMGVSAATLAAPNRRRRNPSMSSRSGPRGIKGGVPVSIMFEDRHRRNLEQAPWTAEHVDNIISRSEWEAEEADGMLLAMAQIDDDGARKVGGKETQNKNMKAPRQRAKTVDGGRLSPGQLVKALVLAMQSEALEFAFPYLVMHRWSWGLLRAVKLECDPLLRQSYGPTYMQHESELPFVVGYILMAASGSGGREKDDRLMRAAAVAVGSMLDAGTGGFVLKMAREMLGFDGRFERDDD